MSLSVREKVKESVKKGGLSNDELHHPSRAYERHFEGYAEEAQSVPGQKRSKSVRTYVDSYWVQECSSRKRLLLRVLFIVLYFLSLIPFLYSATRLIAANTVWFVTLPQALSVFFLGWTALCLYRYCTIPQKMTVRQHRLAVIHFHRASCFAWVALALAAVLYLVHALCFPTEQAATLICTALCLLSCLCILAMFLTERTVRYTESENPQARK